jgi:hypothetical protein
MHNKNQVTPQIMGGVYGQLERLKEKERVTRKSCLHAREGTRQLCLTEFFRFLWSG